MGEQVLQEETVVTPHCDQAKVPAPGVTVGGFRITRLLGQGAMGEVYLAHQLTMGRDVALKILPPRLNSDANLRKRFLNEVRAAACLEHPNIVRAYEAGEDGNLLYLAMAYVRGEPLDSLIRREKRLRESRALDIVEQIALALACAWTKHSILHRDIKPSNIMIDQGGTAMLMDMGLSKMLDADTTLTVAGTVMGTPNYMSPEQAEGKSGIDLRSDMYSLGATFYHMLTGKLPFEASTITETLRKQIAGSLPNPRSVNPDVTKPCAELISIMMAKSPERRHPSWEWVLSDIKRVREGRSPVVATPRSGGTVIEREAHALSITRPPWLRGNIVAVALAIGVAVAAGVGGRRFWLSRETGKRPVPAVPPPPPAEQAFALPRYHALVIGISAYQPYAGEGWVPLTTARGDAEAVAARLEEDFGFTVTRLLDQEASRSAILAAFDRLVNLTQDDAVLVYFAGHGFYDKDVSEGYWIPCDARKNVAGRPVKEDWIWNSTITKVLSALVARHVLVIADSCYAGSLLRGGSDGASGHELDWYRRAVLKPSRFVIASGDIEPVLDSGAHHSVFAQQILNYLSYGDRKVFSASDLGVATRRQVGAVTGQMVQMGPLVTAGHAGGEFVFVRQSAAREFAAAKPNGTDPAADTRDELGTSETPVTPSAAPDRRQKLQDVLDLSLVGATNAANRLMSALVATADNDRLVRAVADYLDSERRSRSRERLSRLIEHLSQRKAALADAPQEAEEALPRPRVLACLGPTARGAAAGSGEGLLYRICLRAELESLGSVQIVDRDAIEDVLKEMDIASSELADARARLTIGKLLPAGMLLAGDVIRMGETDRIYLRLIDTETTRVFAVPPATRNADDDIAVVCAEIARHIADKVRSAKPLSVPVTSVQGRRGRVAAGAFHGLVVGAKLDVVVRGEGDAETKVGTATVLSVNETTAEIDMVFADGRQPADAKVLWVREQTGEMARGL